MDFSDDEGEYDEEKEQNYVRNLEAEGKLLAQNLLPPKSRRIYELAYAAFLKWHDDNQSQPITENLLIAYFKELSLSYSPPTLWSEWSMIKTLLSLRMGIKIDNFLLLKKFLRNFNQSYKAKQAATFHWEHIEKFLCDAEDLIYLAMKVVLILGISGAMRCDEMAKLHVTHMRDMAPPGEVMYEHNHEQFMYYVTITDTKTYIPRTFIVGSIFYPFVKKYADLRPENVNTERFFLFYSKGRCTKQVMGKNRFGDISKCIAAFLNLPNQNDYTGHTYRRTSATLLAHSGANLIDLKSLGGWPSDSVCQGYVDNSYANRIKIFKGIVSANEKLKALPSLSVMRHLPNISHENQLKPADLCENCDKKIFSSSENSLEAMVPNSAASRFVGPIVSQLNPTYNVSTSVFPTKTTCTVTSVSSSVSTPMAPLTSSVRKGTMTMTSPVVSSNSTAYSKVQTQSSDQLNSMKSTNNDEHEIIEDFVRQEFFSDMNSDSMDTLNNNVQDHGKDQLIHNRFEKRRHFYSHQNSSIPSIRNENFQELDFETSFVQFQNCTINNLTINNCSSPNGL